MKLLQWIAGWFGGARKSTGTHGIGLRAALNGGTPGGWASDHREETAHNTGFNYIAIHAIASQVAGATVTVFADGERQGLCRSRRKSLASRAGTFTKWKSTYGADDRETDPLPTTHPLVRLLKRPNPYESGANFRYRQAQQIRLTGTCLVWNVPSLSGPTCERYVIPTSMASPVPPTNDLPRGGWRISPVASRYAPIADNGYVDSPSWYRILGQIVDARQVQVVRLPHAWYLDDGQSPLSAGARWVDAGEAVDEARYHQLKNGIDPSVVWNLPPDVSPDQDEMDRVQARISARYGGPENVGRVMVAQSGTSITPLSTSPREMCYTEGFQDFKAAVLALHQTPPVAVGLQEPGAYAAYNASMKAWRHAAIQPLCDILAESDTEFLAPQFGSGLTVEIESDSVDDTDLIEQQLQNDLAAKVRTKNEWRAVRGMPPLPGPIGDEFVGTEQNNPPATATSGDVDMPVASSPTHVTGKKSLSTETDVSYDGRQNRAGLIAEILYGLFGKSALAFCDDLHRPDEKSFDPSKHPHGELGRWARTGAATNLAIVRDQIASVLNGHRVSSEIFTNVVNNLTALSTDDLSRLHREHGYDPAPSDRSHVLRSVISRLNQLHLPNADRSAFRSASVSGGVEVFVQHEDELHQLLTPFDANQKRPNLSHEQWGDIVGAQPSARVYVYPNMGGVEISADHPDYRSKRRLSRSGLIENVEMRISPRARNSGLATRIFAKQVESAIGLGFRSIECGASGQGTMVRVKEDLYPYRHPKWGGYYAWARFGFDGDISELMTSRKRGSSAHLRGIADDFYSTFPAVKRVSQLMKTPEGRDWWQKFGGYFNGVFNLKKGSLSRRVFSEYLAEKAAGSKPKSLETPLDEPGTATTGIEEPDWLTADDEAILDRIWDRIGRKPVQNAETSTDVETPEE